MVTRRNFLKSSAALSALAAMPLSLRWSVANALAQQAGRGLFLSDPAGQPKFINPVPDAMAPGFKYVPDRKGYFNVGIQEADHLTGLVGAGGTPLTTKIWGYADATAGTPATWPGKTFDIQNFSASRNRKTVVNWTNQLTATEHLLPVDTNLHWCYSLHGYTGNTIAANGVPTITHLHGGHSDFEYDGNPEFFSSATGVIGPQWAFAPKGFTNKFKYDNDVPAGNLWYHDHALGITRLNVYAGLAGFYFVRDGLDTGQPNNPLGLPAWPYEKAYAIQDRMFEANGKLFYPAYPGDPFYADFIEGEGANLPGDLFPNGGPTGLAEFFGDHMLVNGIAWPLEKVEARSYRLRLLNGTDSRFMGLRFRQVAADATDLTSAGATLGFHVIGSDQGLTTDPVYTTELVFEPGARYDVVINFDQIDLGYGSRVIMENYLGDAPFGGELPGADDIFVERQTDRIMAFDVIAKVSIDPWPASPLVTLAYTGQFGGAVVAPATRIRKVALFEGKDEFGRLQPLLGTAEPATDYLGNPVNWPNDPKYSAVGLVGQMEGAIAWHSPTTENPALGATEEWEIWNGTGDAHPVHVHLVHFEVLGRKEIVWDSHTIEDGTIDPATGDELEEDRVIPNALYELAAGDGTYKVMQPTVQHNSVAGDSATYGMGFKFQNLTYGPAVATPAGYVENAPKDMVIALPNQVTRIKATFDKPGRYVWHCHILSHEDHEMMRVMHVGPGA